MAYALVPVAWIVSLSFKAGDDITNKKFLPTDWYLENYRIVFSSDLFTSALRNSIGISLIATAISVVLAMFAAYAVARLEFPGKKLLLSLALAITIFPIIAIATPLFNLWRTVGLYDTWLGLIIPYLSFSLPLSVYVLSRVLPRDPVGDGAGRAGGRGHPAAGVPQGHRPAGRAGGVHRGDPHLLRHLERLHLRHHAHLSEAARPVPGRAGVLLAAPASSPSPPPPSPQRR